MGDCTHGYPKEWRRHCVDCQHNDDIAELQLEIDRMKSAIVQLYKAFSRGKQTQGPIHRCLMAAGGFGILEEVTADGEETTEEEYEYGVGPEGAD